MELCDVITVGVKDQVDCVGHCGTFQEPLYPHSSAEMPSITVALNIVPPYLSMPAETRYNY